MRKLLDEGRLLTRERGYQLIVAPAIPVGATREELAYPRKWPALLAVIYGFVFLAFVAMYEAGLQPFPWPPRSP